jgi:hypothetical protein
MGGSRRGRSSNTELGNEAFVYALTASERTMACPSRLKKQPPSSPDSLSFSGTVSDCPHGRILHQKPGDWNNRVGMPQAHS